MTSGREPELGYESVRAALRAQGYLETPLERAFLGAGLGSGTRARALLSALLAGLLGGPVLGLLLAISLVLDSARSVPMWPDGLLYAVLFAPVLGALIALSEALIGYLVGLRARARGDLSLRRTALASGFGVATLLAAYLGLWWAASGGPVRTSDLAALALLALGAGLVGRIVSAAVLVRIALRLGRAPRLRRPRFARWIGSLSAAGTLVGVLLSLLAIPGRTPGEPVERSATAPERAILVGWDGLSLDLAQGMMRRGDLPWLSAQWGRSHRGRLERTGSGDPVSLWTTIATGCEPAEHGVDGAGLLGLAGASGPAPRGGPSEGPMAFLLRLLPTRERVVRAGVRRVPSLWEVAADATKTSVVGWWATWPAASPGRAGGYVVSDGALVAAREDLAVEEAVFPGSWGAHRHAAWLDRARAQTRSALGEEFGAGPFYGLRAEALETDFFAVEALADALRDPDLRVAAVYLPGFDILRERGRASGVDLFLVLDALERHGRVVDRRLGEVLPRGRDELISVVSLPGRAGEGESGLVALARGAEAEGVDLAEDVALTAVAPTFLSAAGLTIDARMSGRAVEELVRGCGGSVSEPRRTRAEVAVATGGSRAFEDDVLERLRSLGYVD